MPITIDWPALERSGFTLAQEPLVTVSLRNIRFGSALDLMLQTQYLAYYIENGAIRITTVEVAEHEKTRPIEKTNAELTRDQLEEQELKAKLQMPVKMEFKRTHFSDVIDFLRDQSGVNFVVYRVGFDTGDCFVTVSARDTPLADALQTILYEMKATYVIRDGVVVIMGGR